MNYKWLLLGDKGIPDFITEPLLHYGEFIHESDWKAALDNTLQDAGVMMVINCKSETADTANIVNENAGHIENMLEQNHPVLLLAPSRDVKQQLMDAHIVPCCLNDESVALFIEPRRDENGCLRVALVEQFDATGEYKLESVQVTMNSEGKILTEEKKDCPITETTGLNFLDVEPFITRIRNTMHTLIKGEMLPFNEVQPNRPPSNVPGNLWTNTPITIFETINPGGKAEGSFTPPTGNITMECLISVGIYYDNTKYNHPVQWVYLEHSGHLHTTMQRDDNDARGWSLGKFILSGDNISSSEFISNSTSPNNVSGSTTYTSQSGFNVGLAAGTQGITGDIHYNISSSETVTISDWELVQLDTNSWKMYQNTPFSGEVTGFPDGCCNNDGVKNLPAISKSTLAYNTQTTWIHNPATGSGRKSVNYMYETRSFFTWCDSHSSTSWHAWNWYYWCKKYRQLTLDFSAAYPK